MNQTTKSTPKSKQRSTDKKARYRGLSIDNQRAREAFGRQHKALRLAAEKTQLQLAAEVGIDYYTMVSQIECGTARLPPARITEWAKALNISATALAARLLFCLEPELYDILFGDVWIARLEAEAYRKV